MRAHLRFIGRFALPAILSYFCISAGVTGLRAIRETRDGDAWTQRRLAAVDKVWHRFATDANWPPIARTRFFLGKEGLPSFVREDEGGAK